MNIALWVVQGMLAGAFVFIGSMKVFAYPTYIAMIDKNGPSGITRGLAAFIGIAEIAGGIGLILPMATGVAAWLTPWAAIGLAAIMILAVGFHLRRRESPVPPFALLVLAVFVTWGRFTYRM
jgi:putative oxidoreductase